MILIKLNNTNSLILEKLIDTRLLAQANSGGGKSWLIRRIIEEAFGKVQIIVLDPEGEFTNLREKYDFVIAGKDGDAPAESKSATLLAHRLLELKVSAIVDLYELPPHERKHFVKLFFDSMVNAPKELWHDCLVILDEAHIFAPEKGESEALGSVIDLATRGRKRGFCLIPATQRLSKLNKDVAAECNNKLIGRASQDIDRKRAAEELGFTTKEQIISLRNLRPGEFYAFGPAISDDVIKLTVGDLHVKPAMRGQLKHIMPPPTEKIRKILGKLADLPAEALKEARTKSELQKQIKTLTHELIQAKKTHSGVSATKIQKIEVPAVGKRTLEKLIVSEKNFRKMLTAVKEHTAVIESGLGKFTLELQKINHPIKENSGLTITSKNLPSLIQNARQKIIISGPSEPIQLMNFGIEGISGPEQKILDAIAWFESIQIIEPEQTAVAFLAGYTFGGGAFNNTRSSLRTKGLLEYRGNKIALTENGRHIAKIPELALTQHDLHKKILDILPGPERKLMIHLLECYPQDISNEELATATGYTAGSGGFNNPKSRLRTLGLVDYVSAGRLKAKDFLFLE